ncbi:late competence protein ComER [Calidifontibacillus oryziterrae]|uniref:late competence protein ComER n=1 Tax=Calidifontibacillus oryziterrae TaxID=1191699 RepID=UPI0002DCC810|nr:late competence protein ComER [Calidifontibacillus oryziterrae]
MNIGIVGTGNMGKILIDAFLISSAVTEQQLFIINRSKAKAEHIKCVYPNIQVMNSVEDVINHCDFIFICVKPVDIYSLLQQCHTTIRKEQCIISITSPISVKQLESVVPCSVARVIPSINNRVLSGTSLLTFGESCKYHHQKTIIQLMEKISAPVVIEEEFTRVASDITSCGPAFFTFLLRRFIEAAVNETQIPEEQASLLATKMLIGMGQLIEQEVYTLETLQEKVCVKGGITGEGIKVLEAEVGQMFHHVIQATHAKFFDEKKKISEQFGIIN